MRAIWLIALIAITGCATMRPWGATTEDAAVIEAVAIDVAERLAQRNPPAKTQYMMTPKDAFGSELALVLRERGFAVAETDEGQGRALSYLLDQLASDDDELADEWHVTVDVDGERLARAYRRIDGTVIAVGIWSVNDGK